MDRLLSAEHLGEPISVSTLAYWRQCGTGPKWFRSGRHFRYRESAVTEWQAAQELAAADARA